MEATSESTSTIKQRHGCVTTWLILMIVLNSFTALLYIFGSDSISKKYSRWNFQYNDISIGHFGIIKCSICVYVTKMEKDRFLGFYSYKLSSICRKPQYWTRSFSIIVGIDWDSNFIWNFAD